MTIKSYADNNPSIIAPKIACYKKVEVRKIIDSLLTIDYTAIHVYNHLISRRLYELYDNMSDFIVVTPSPHTTFRNFTSLDSWSLRMFHICFHERQRYSLILSVTCYTDDIIAWWPTTIVIVVTLVLTPFSVQFCYQK
jgi:hypothetical protein